MKKLKNNFILLIICFLMCLSAPTYADKPSDDVFKVPSIEKIEEVKPEKFVDDIDLQEDIETDTQKALFQDSFWNWARIAGFGFLGVLILFFIIGIIRRNTESKSVVDTENTIDSYENKNFDDALNTFIKRNL